MGIVVIVLLIYFYYSYREEYVKKNGNDDGYFECYIKWCMIILGLLYCLHKCY